MNDQNERNEQEEPVNENQENQQEESREAAIPVASVPKRDFRGELTEFFKEHNPKRVKHVIKIADKFRGKEDLVMNHLREQYSDGQAPEKRKKDYTKTTKAKKSDTKGKEKATKKGAAAEPKSKKKLIMLIVIAVVVIGLGVAGYFFKDKIMALIGKGIPTEEIIPDDGSTPGEPVAEEPAAEEPAVEEPAVIVDSAAVDSAAVIEGDTAQPE